MKDELEHILKVGFVRPTRYVEWLANIVLVPKKSGKVRIYIDFRHLNFASLKDEYPMPIAYLQVGGAAKHNVLSFMDDHFGYNKIYIAKEDVHKTAFRCPGALGAYE